MSNRLNMAELLLPHIDKTPEYYEKLYPERQLSEGARVTRVAPSPTGYLHLGVLYMSLIDRLTADSTGGIFYTRIEDTDKKREIEGGVENIIGGLTDFGIAIDEGFTAEGQIGAYGPYKQSDRKEIYQCYVKKLISQGLAYPCFCTAEELEAVRTKQEAEKIRTGYHGKWAKHRDITFEEAKSLIESGIPYVVRLKSTGSEEKRITFDDGIKGKIEMPENDEDFVLLKSDGIPTYHFAHAVDDHLMRTTHVIRGDEWISSTPKHIELFRLLEFKVPKFAHVAPIMKLDDGNKRKISKRKDPEAAVQYFAEQGYPAESVMEYLMTIASSEFEGWRKANPTDSYQNFKFNLKKMSLSGALFDGDKLVDVSKNVISRMDSIQVTEAVMAWAEQYDKAFFQVLAKNPDYSRAVFSIDRDVPKPRKDIAKWSDAPVYAEYFFDELYKANFELPEQIEKSDAAVLLKSYAEVYDPSDERDGWFGKIKDICPAHGFSPDIKEYKQNPDAYKGHAGDVSTIIRIAVTGRQNTPDLCSIMKLLGKERCVNRLLAAAEYYDKNK